MRFSDRRAARQAKMIRTRRMKEELTPADRTMFVSRLASDRKNIEVSKDFPCILILDIYPSHRTDLVVTTTEANDVERLFVPPAQQEDSNPSTAEYSGSLRLAHERNAGYEWG
jgi:hypothetical protein